MHIKQNYTANCLRVIDGDTILVQMDCPSCGDSKKMRIRLARIDAPDFPRNTKNAVAASTEFLRKLVESKVCVISLCQKWPDKYGRLVAEVFCEDRNLSNVMLTAGFAELYSSRGASADIFDGAGDSSANLDDFKWCGAKDAGRVKKS